MARREMRRSAPWAASWADTSPGRHAASSETLTGLVERVTFHNPDNGFCVLRVKARGRMRSDHRCRPRAGDQRRRIRSGHGHLDQRPDARTPVQATFLRAAPYDARGDREVSRLRHDQGSALSTPSGWFERSVKRCSMSSRISRSDCERSTASARSAPGRSLAAGPIRRSSARS